jgi:hypothetical protein
MSARNLKAFAEGQDVRAAIKTIMSAHSPLAWPLTAKAINARLPAHLRRGDNDIRHHMRAIRREAAAYIGVTPIPSAQTPIA